MLEIQSWKWSRLESVNYVEAVGQVKNLSSQNLKNVAAVLQVYDKDDQFINSETTLIEYNPLLPSQVSPFRVLMSWNPAMQHAELSFKDLLGGTIKSRKKPD